MSLDMVSRHRLLKRQAGDPTSPSDPTTPTQPTTTQLPPTTTTTTPVTPPPTTTPVTPQPPTTTPPSGGGGSGLSTASTPISRGPGGGPGSTPNPSNMPGSSVLPSATISSNGNPSSIVTQPGNTLPVPVPSTTLPTTIPTGPPPVTTSTTTVTSIDSSTPVAPVASDASHSDASNKGFFHNTGAVAGVFSVAGIAVLILAFFLISTAIRRRRARAFDREVAEAAAHAQSIDPNALDDDSYGSSGGPTAAGASLAYSKSLSSHGTMMQEPMNPDRGLESYGMADLGAGAGLAGLGGYRGAGAADDYYRTPDGGYGAARFATGGVAPSGYAPQQGGYGYGYGPAGYEGGYTDYPVQGQQQHQGYAQQGYDQQAYDQQAYDYQGRPPPPSQAYYAGAAPTTDDPFRSQTHTPSRPSPPPPRTSATDEVGPLSTAFRGGGTDEDGGGYAYGGEEQGMIGQAIGGRDDDEGSVNEDTYEQRRVLKVANAD